MKYYLTTPIYYVNMKPHIGHAYTTIIADVVARSHRLRGYDVFFLTGTDEHGAKIAKKAKEVGLSPQVHADAVSAEFKTAWKALNISYDRFIRTTDEDHIRGAQRVINQLHENKALYEKDYQGLYCVGCERFLTDKELVDGKCPDHKIAPELIKEKNYFFKLGDYLSQVKKVIEDGTLAIEPEKRKNEIMSLIDQQLEDFSISRETVEWGIPVPFDSKQTIYVWIEALTNYINALGYGENGVEAEQFKKLWPADDHLMAKDILKFHALYWPALLLALGLPLPKRIYAHGHFTISGEKMSKTIGNVIDPNDLVAKWGADAVRYLLLNQFPVGDDGDVSIERMQAQYDSDLANDLGNLLQRTLVMMNKYKVPPVECEGTPYNTEIHQSFTARCPNAYVFDNEQFLGYIDSFKLDKALEIIKEIISGGNKYIEKEKPWELAKESQEKCEYVLQGLYNRLMLIALLIEPFMPTIAVEMKRQLTQMDPSPMFKKEPRP